MGFGGCFQDLDLIDGAFADEFLVPLLSSQDRISLALRFLESMKFKRMDAFSELHRDLAMPVSFVWGAADPTFPEARARAMASQFPNVAQFRSIPKGKLFLQEEFPDAVAKAVTDLLTRVVPKPHHQKMTQHRSSALGPGAEFVEEVG
jgi:pimeloyl-ACP methyl ester carboxylesterase